MKCPHCGEEISNDSKYCEYREIKVKKKMKPLSITIAVVIVILALCGFGYYQYDNTKQKQVRLKAELEVKTKAKQEAKPEVEDEKQTQFARTHGSKNGYDWVDLGLPSGLKWATCNYGASSLSEYGSYLTHNDDMTNSDAFDAVKQWGGTWRLPTVAEFQELIINCLWTWTSIDGNNGYKVTGPNGNSIFLPAAGYRYYDSYYGLLSTPDTGDHGSYWSSTRYMGSSYGAGSLYFDSGSLDVYCADYSSGRAVRPVTE
ncbi:MAG: hypothetical protein IJZ87_06605 [Bacteroidales bacterium]|nr:hypothetical protein [Bacteroidales bacterium]